MKLFQHYVGEKVKLDISGGKFLKGILIEIGSDVLVLYNGKDYLYIPFTHVHHITILDIEEYDVPQPTEEPNLEYDNELSLRKILTSARGMFTEIYVTSNQPLHGYITSVLNNYFVFYSPLYKTMFISLNHLKWLIPYNMNQRPYGLTNQDFPLKPVNISLARSFEIQLEKHMNELIVFNIGENQNVIGKLKSIKNNVIELITAREDCIYLNQNHIKTVHFS